MLLATSSSKHRGFTGSFETPPPTARAKIWMGLPTEFRECWVDFLAVKEEVEEKLTDLPGSRSNALNFLEAALHELHCKLAQLSAIPISAQRGQNRAQAGELLDTLTALTKKLRSEYFGNPSNARKNKKGRQRASKRKQALFSKEL
jgi:hypothetical protein